MTTRTFIQQGQGYGSTPVDVTVKIGGTVVYSGTIPTLDEPPPQGGTGATGPLTNLFSWTNDVNFSGQQDFEVSVDGGLMLMTQTVANYTVLTDSAGNTFPGNATSFGGFWIEQVGNVLIGDPFTNEQIDGIPSPDHPDPTQLTGQWWWYVPNGSTFTATLNVSAGNVG